ncbi:MAG: CBS domain-containing protein, partial [Gammaproteobacteria bacterium]
MSEVETTSFEECLQRLIDSLEASSYEDVRVQVAEMHPAEVARLIEALTPNLRMSLLNVIEHSIQGQILTELNEDVKIQLLAEMETNSIVKATEGLDMDDLADIVPNLPESALHNLLLTLDYKHREHLKQVLSFPEDSAGGLMNTDIITIRPDVKLRSVIRYLRLLGEVPQDTDQIFVVDRSFKFLGSITLSTILTNEPELMVEPLMEDNIPAINSETNSKDVVTLFQDRNLISAPVIDEKGELIGRITIDDVVDVIREDAEQSVLSMAGLDQDEDVFAPVFQSTKRRSIWLGVNLITAFIAVFFIG